jgi:hypothetical protein
VQGILAFAERVLPRASDLWVQASFDYTQRLQQLFFPEGIAYDGNRLDRTAQRHHFSVIWRLGRVLMKSGEPHFRELEPHGRMAQACRGPSEGRMREVPHDSRQAPLLL